MWYFQQNFVFTLIVLLTHSGGLVCTQIGSVFGHRQQKAGFRCISCLWLFLQCNSSYAVWNKYGNFEKKMYGNLFLNNSKNDKNSITTVHSWIFRFGSYCKKYTRSPSVSPKTNVTLESTISLMYPRKAGICHFQKELEFLIVGLCVHISCLWLLYFHVKIKTFFIRYNFSTGYTV